MRAPRVGLALGGGAARGFAHIGVLQVLEEKGFKVDMVAGTSAGSLVAALFASGKDAKALSVLADQMDESKITDWVFPSRGLIKGEALSRYVNQQVGGRTMEQMRLPLGVVATDLASGEPIVFRRGDTGLAVRASATVPGVFQPVKIGSREYVDGGLVAPVPVRAVHEMGAEFVIAVDISSAPEGASTKGTSDVMLQTFTIMGKSINRHELKEADVVVRPNLPGVSSADFTARKKSIQAGREAMLAAWPELQRKLAAKQIPI
jgi:NTE family protein